MGPSTDPVSKPRRGYDCRMSIERLRTRRGEILALAARHGMRNVRVFGSVARGDDRPDSDIDLLVDVEPGRSLLDVIGFEQDLGQLLERRIEVLTDGGLSPYLQQRILEEAAFL
jgi:predicted nucleotidyltransferase